MTGLQQSSSQPKNSVMSTYSKSSTGAPSSSTSSLTTSTNNSSTGYSASDTTTYPANSQFYATIPDSGHTSQVFDLSQLSKSAQTYLSQLPPAWVQNATAEQIQGLLQELHSFQSNMHQMNSTNLPSTYVEPVVTAFTENDYSNGIIVPSTSGSDPFRTASTVNSDPEHAWWEAIDIPQLTAAKEAIGRGYNLLSAYSSSEEALAALGEGALEVVGENAAIFGLEGAAAGAAEFLGGAAAIGGFIAGGELIAGAALIGFGVYEVYKGLGGDASSTIDSLSNTAASAFAGIEGAQNTINQVQGYVSSAQEYYKEAEAFASTVESWFGGP